MTRTNDVTATSAGMSRREAVEQSRRGAGAQFREVKDQVVDQAKNSFRQARDSATSSLTDSRKQAAERIGRIADAVRTTSEHLRSEDQPTVANLTESLADQAERLSSYLRDRDLRAFRDDAENIARRQPGVALGVALAMGLLAARFIKSSQRSGGGSSSSRAYPSRVYEYDRQPDRGYAADSGVTSGYGPGLGGNYGGV
jgi:hypothetical protein